MNASSFIKFCLHRYATRKCSKFLKLLVVAFKLAPSIMKIQCISRVIALYMRVSLV